MPPAVGFNWTGLYLGLNGGGGIGVDRTKQNTAFSSNALGANGLLQTSNNVTPVGGLIGGQIGYNWQISPLVILGFEADGQWASQSGDALMRERHRDVFGAVLVLIILAGCALGVMVR